MTSAESEKIRLLRRHRRQKRLGAALALAGLALLGAVAGWWLLVPGLLLLWIGHEAWFADHRFYNPRADYAYRFAAAEVWPMRLIGGRLVFAGAAPSALPALPVAGENLSLLARVSLQSGWLGRLFDPTVRTGDVCQTFERGARGVRYLNLSGLEAPLLAGELGVVGRFCRLAPTVEVLAFRQPAVSGKELLVIAPHADDAEIAAFGLYRQTSRCGIVTVSQGEVEAGSYERFGLAAADAARLKGRLRAWESRAVPQWGGVAPERCLQLGYPCLQLAAMQQAPAQGFASLVCGDADTRPLRRGNALALPGDVDGVASWRNLVADLAAVIERWQPQVIALPHPEIDPHPDHRASAQALLAALAASAWQPETLLFYANHLANHDAWPLGGAGGAAPLPPLFHDLPAAAIYCQPLDATAQIDKALALRMAHDLQTPLRRKERLRRGVQRLLLGRRWPDPAGDEFFRKAVRCQEIFWSEPFAQRALPADGGSAASVGGLVELQTVRAGQAEPL